LADFQQHHSEFRAHGARVIAISADDPSDARATVQQLGLEFEVVAGVDPERVSMLIGCYTGTHDGRPHLQPAAFVLMADGTIAHAVYSSGKVGRLTADDALTIIKDLGTQRRAAA
jgi:peroxiredoxin